MFCYHLVMREPSLRTSRLAIAGALVATAAVGGAGFYLGRATSSDAAREAQNAPTPTPAPLPAVSDVIADRVLDRADLIELAAAAADAGASGAPLPDEVRDAVDRRFEIAVPFGCSGAAAADSDAPLRWRYDAEAETLRLHVAVTRWEAADWNLEGPGDSEAIEGFWIARPWSSSGECPRRATPPSPAASPQPIGGEPPAAAANSSPNPVQTLAIAQFLGGDVRREVLREGRPFQSVQRIARANFAAPRGFRLLLSGRIDEVPGAQGPVHCVQPGGFEQRPRCIVAVTLDEVRIENPAIGAVLASWPIGHD